MFEFFVIVIGNFVFSGVDFLIEIFLIFFLKMGLLLFMFSILIFVGIVVGMIFFEV